MKIPTLAKSQLIVYGVGAAAALALVYTVYRILKSPFSTEGTPYEDAGKRGGIPGAVGGLAAATDRLSGGLLSEAGSALGGALYDLVGNDYTSSVTFTFTFRDGPHAGKKGAVNADEVDEFTGRFNYYKDGGAYTLRKDAQGNKFAVKV